MKKSNVDSGDFEWFEDRGARITDAYVTITESDTFLFSSGFIHEAGISGDVYVKFGYNETKNLIAFDFTPDRKVKGCYKVVLRGEKAKSGSVTSRSFFKNYKLKSKKFSGRYAPEKQKIPRAGEFWIIDLNKRLEK